MLTRNAPLVLALAICLGLSVAAEKIGMAAIIGAFFAGLAFSEFSPEWNLLPRVGAITELLTPFFFFVMGAKLRLSAFSNPKVLEITIIISILAILSTLIGCGLPVLGEMSMGRTWPRASAEQRRFGLHPLQNLMREKCLK